MLHLAQPGEDNTYTRTRVLLKDLHRNSATPDEIRTIQSIIAALSARMHACLWYRKLRPEIRKWRWHIGAVHFLEATVRMASGKP